MSRFRITIVHNGDRINAIAQHRSGGEALAELCDALNIIYPTYASVVKVPA